ncbi:GH92 family glycosyl hydrolase [Coprobacter tertius]|uniref:GH92 family glycosyl hydrolase n=1 Tax=Coprobacter tertius TaxID=2944915 RepID=A0ABT1MH66_9BACT|nr:GH92 family glycosyl hydrolase [Coprobacter tertius]MCP9611394.1 GH92 family glycosyl hydrolase [Coprobacter tertius]
MRTNVKLLSLIALSCSVLFSCQTGKRDTKAPEDKVYMYIGTINPKTRGAIPVIKVPGGSVGLFPSFTPGFTDMYVADKIYGFPIGNGSLMIGTGDTKKGIRANASTYDHDLETATPYYYQVLLEDPGVNAEFTVTANTIVFRFDIPKDQRYDLLLNMPKNASFALKDSSTIAGSSTGRNNAQNFYTLQLSRPCQSFDQTADGWSIGFPASPNGETLEVKVGISPENADRATDFIAQEIGTMTFDQVKQKAKKAWNEELSLIKVKGGTEKQQELFYTTLHRTRALRMGNVWDTYRSAYPLQSLIKPEDTNKAIREFIRKYEETGWLPSSGAMIGHHSTAVIADAYMRGVRDYDVEKAYEGMKKNALQATMIPWRDSGYVTELEQCYFDKGFYPALPVKKGALVPAAVTNDINEKMPYQVRWMPETGVKEWVKEVDSWHRRQSVSVTLEHCYDDWCLAQMAKELGKEDDYTLFMKRAHNYRNLFKPSIGLMAPKSADGEWIEPFDPKYSGGFAGEAYFAEGNSWVYTWHVQHDVQGLINLMGGKEKFVRKLDELFSTSHRMDKLTFLGQFPDMTGLMGMYCQGNEPVFHIPYLYNYAGQPWKTQKKVRQIMDLWFDTDPHGISGDEDGGAMSSWYVFSAMGLYPQCPGRPIFDIGSPVFDEVSINVGNGKTFVIEAKNVSAQNKYIQSATLNGKPFDQTWINHSDIVKGGKLVFEMGPRPNKQWGSSPEAAAPSMSAPENE